MSRFSTAIRPLGFAASAAVVVAAAAGLGACARMPEDRWTAHVDSRQLS